MIKILIAEIKYSKSLLGLIVSLPLVFVGFAALDIKVLSNISFMERYFWAMIVGLGTYILVYAIWMQRTKEKRERLHCVLPISNKQRAVIRWIFAVSPYLYAMISVQIFQFYLNEDWSTQVGRISAQLGLLAVFLAVFFISHDQLFIKSKRFKCSTIIVFNGCIGLAGVIAIILLANYEIVEPLYIHWEELLFFVWAITISMVSLITYRLRSSFMA